MPESGLRLVFVMVLVSFIAGLRLAEAIERSWVLLVTTPEGDKRYLTNEEPFKTTAGTHTVATRTTFANKRPMAGKPVNAVEAIEEYDCARGKMRTVVAAILFEDGTNSSMTCPTAWQSIKPESLGAHTYRAACQRQGKP